MSQQQHWFLIHTSGILATMIQHRELLGLTGSVLFDERDNARVSVRYEGYVIPESAYANLKLHLPTSPETVQWIQHLCSINRSLVRWSLIVPTSLKTDTVDDMFLVSEESKGVYTTRQVSEFQTELAKTSEYQSFIKKRGDGMQCDKRATLSKRFQAAAAKGLKGAPPGAAAAAAAAAEARANAESTTTATDGRMQDEEASAMIKLYKQKHQPATAASASGH